MSEFDIHDLRRRILNGEEVTRADVRAAIEHLAPHRAGAIEAADAASAKASSTRKAAPPSKTIDLGDLL